jgi:hypothetical protein
MRDILPETYQLAEAPELAALHVLDAAVAATEAAIGAAYPELDEVDLCSEMPPDLSTDAHVADALLTHLSSLHTAIHRYVGIVRRRYSLRVLRITDDF